MVSTCIKNAVELTPSYDKKVYADENYEKAMYCKLYEYNSSYQAYVKLINRYSPFYSKELFELFQEFRTIINEYKTLCLSFINDYREGIVVDVNKRKFEIDKCIIRIDEKRNIASDMIRDYLSSLQMRNDNS